MKRTPRSACWLLAGAIAFGSLAPGCSAIASALYQLMIFIGKEVARTAIGHVIEKKLDEWVFNRNDSANKQGDVRVSSGDPQRGTYDGKMEILVKDEAAGTTDRFEVTNPAMRRGPDGEWKLDKEVIDEAKRVLKRRKGLP
jgi:hypothetical protein